MAKQFITIVDDGVSYQVPDKFIYDRIHGEYKNLPRFQAFGRAIGDYIALLEQAKGEAREEA